MLSKLLLQLICKKQGSNSTNPGFACEEPLASLNPAITTLYVHTTDLLKKLGHLFSTMSHILNLSLCFFAELLSHLNINFVSFLICLIFRKFGTLVPSDLMPPL